MVNGRIIGMAGPPGDPADGWEENQTLVGGVLFFLCPLLQIPSYCFSCPMQEKSVPFFTARCMSYCFYGEIFICGDCAVATPFKMPSNNKPASLYLQIQIRANLRLIFHSGFACILFLGSLDDCFHICVTQINRAIFRSSHFFIYELFGLVVS